MTLVLKNNRDQEIPAVRFFADDASFTRSSLKEGDRVDIIAHLERNIFRNSAELRLRVVDIR